MSIGDVLVILGCLAGGYWIVNSVMGPGVDITRGDAANEERLRRQAQDAKQLPNPRQSDWHLLLDIPRSADRSEIEAAYRRQLNKALVAGDAQQQEQLRLARDAALAGESHPAAR